MSQYLVGDHFEDFHAYLDANYAFHESIVALSGNPLLIAAFGSLSIKNVMARSFGTTAQSSATFLQSSVTCWKRSRTAKPMRHVQPPGVTATWRRRGPASCWR